MTYSDEQVARVCHEANKALQYIHGDPCPSQPWNCEPDEQKQSAIEGVRSVRRGTTPRQLHETWLTFKSEHGWTWGPVKDPERKTHPCMVAYDDLPQEQRDKDQLFLMIVTALTVGMLSGIPARGYQENERNRDKDPGRAGR